MKLKKMTLNGKKLTGARDENRMKNNRKPLIIIQIPFILDEKNIPISATRIKDKIIDENGKILTGD